MVRINFTYNLINDPNETAAESNQTFTLGGVIAIDKRIIQAVSVVLACL